MTDSTTTVLDSRQAPTQHVALLQALHAAPQRVGALVAALPAGAADWRPTPETWSSHMLVAHLAGGEAPFLKRMQMIVTETNPFLPYFGPDVARPDASGSLEELLAQYQRERSALVRLLVDLPPEAWERPALHQTMGPTTLANQAQNIANHDAEHLAQLAELARAYQEQRNDA